MPVEKVSAKELLGGRSVIMPGSAQFARLKKYHEEQAAAREDKLAPERQPDPERQSDPERQPDPEPPTD